MSTLPLFDPQPLTPLQRKEVGMEKVRVHADFVSPNWSERCYELLLVFAEKRKLWAKPFITEEFTEYAKSIGMEMPHDNRAFGAVVSRAKREHKIQHVGYRTDKFASPKSEWEAL
jgi:hypothetical protein